MIAPDTIHHAAVHPERPDESPGRSARSALGAGTRPLAPRRFERRVDPRTGEPYLAVFRRGATLKDDPILNKGTCFTLDERDTLGLRGVIPPAVSNPTEQEARAYENYQRAGDDVGRYLFLAALQDRNETLFYRLVVDHLEEMVPIIYTPTVGKVCERYSHLYRRPRGLYISSADRGRIADVLRNSGREHPQIIVATDNEAILGIGDQGVGGMAIAVGKVALYTAGAGIHPMRGLPLDIDVGTDDLRLLEDPLYLGSRHPRLRGEAYFSLLDELVESIRSVFPGVLVQWEDFASDRAFDVLGRYREELLSFDDDIQGTGAVVEAGIRTALDRIGGKLEDQRMLFYGAGASGGGCARQLRRALRDAGVAEGQVARQVLVLDSKGLVLADRAGLMGHKRDIAADPSVVQGWPEPGAEGSTRRNDDRVGDGRADGTRAFGLLDVVRHFKPTILVGVAGQAGAFTEEIVRTLHKGCARPIVLALSNPTSQVEASPEDVLQWTGGAVIVATGSPFPPVHLNGIDYEIGQCNNALVFPGIGLGAAAIGAQWLPDAAFSAAARAVYEFTGRASAPGAPVFPRLSRLRDVSRAVAVAVGRALVDAGAAPYRARDRIEELVAASVWEPMYLPYRAA